LRCSRLPLTKAKKGERPLQDLFKTQRFIKKTPALALAPLVHSAHLFSHFYSVQHPSGKLDWPALRAGALCAKRQEAKKQGFLIEAGHWRRIRRNTYRCALRAKVHFNEIFQKKKIKENKNKDYLRFLAIVGNAFFLFTKLQSFL
jgi:hypothetical protein